MFLRPTIRLAKRFRCIGWYNGGCPGASALFFRAPSGMCGAALANIHNEEMAKAWIALLLTRGGAVPEWHEAQIQSRKGICHMAREFRT